jgi:hypothetical protein
MGEYNPLTTKYRLKFTTVSSDLFFIFVDATKQFQFIVPLLVNENCIALTLRDSIIYLKVQVSEFILFYL